MCLYFSWLPFKTTTQCCRISRESESYCYGFIDELETKMDFGSQLEMYIECIENQQKHTNKMVLILK